ncbi:family 43 glycosylhydrolase [Paenibacillus sp. 2TAB19]
MDARKKFATLAAAVGIAAAALISGCSNNESANQPSGTENAGKASSEPSLETSLAAEDRIFWKPPVGWVGDIMPFSEGDKLHLFYLQDWRDGAPGFHPWHMASTSNLTDYEYAGEAIPFGVERDQDLALGTGSVIKANDTYHAFYTGHNWQFPDQGKPKEAVMHAVSVDLKTWTKVPEDTFYAPNGYETHDFRDPFVLYNEEKGEYWMLQSARKSGKGVIALFASKDLSKWELREPLTIEATDNFFMLECPDVFYMDGKWYLVFSEFSDKKATHYRVSDSLDGPWKKPESDMFDGRAFYAAKTETLGDRRMLYGWVPTRQLEKDYMQWDWAGNMVAHQMTLSADGSLGVKVPDEIDALLSKEEALAEPKKIGAAAGDSKAWKLSAAAGGVAGIVFGELPQTAKITGSVRFDEKVEYSGFVVGAGDEPEKAYGIQLEPAKDRVRYDAVKGDTLSSVEPDVQVSAELEANTDYSFTIVIENDVAVLYIGDSALTTRIYKMPGQAWGWYSRGGETTLSGLKLFVPTK